MNAPTSEEEQRRQRETEDAEEERKQSFLAAILDADARERLARVKLVKPDKARGLERTILKAAQEGKIGKVSETMLIDMLRTVSESEKGGADSTGPSITFRRKKNAFDDDDDNDEW